MKARKKMNVLKEIYKLVLEHTVLDFSLQLKTCSVKMNNWFIILNKGSIYKWATVIFF